MIDETDAAGETPDDGDPSSGVADASAAAESHADDEANADVDENEADAATTASDADAAPTSGVLAAIPAFARKHRLPLIIAGGVVAFGLIGAGAVAAGVASNGGAAASVAAVTTPTPTPTVDPARPVPAAIAAAARLRTCSVADRAGDGRLANFQAQVMNAATGEVLYDRGGTTASRTASVMKVLTSAAALSVLGPDYRTPTTVVKGAEPGSVVLVGGGDAT
ncbi:MAG TPA: D-alanyl-D-alanine carboxypeptidase, partial [Microbacterium sp.]|uniref:D-alanyl-D-alanine carboxypeptidase n=1 Tax=Microbacterium sp. TaxID=51671 RepID=UPI002F943CFB